MVRYSSSHLQQCTGKISYKFGQIKVAPEAEVDSSIVSAHSCVQFNWYVKRYNISAWTKQYTNPMILFSETPASVFALQIMT